MKANSFMTEENFRLFFEAAPHPYLLLYPDDAFSIAGVNERYLAATGTERSAIVGRGLFEVFPDNPGDPKATGVSDLRSSLERVKRERVTDIMGVQKYDIPSAGAGGSFAVKYWSPVNTPAFAADGSLCFIIHHVEDVTEFILSRERAVRESVEYMGLVQARADRMEAEVLLRAGEVKEANRQIKAAMEELARREAELARLNEQLKELDRAKTAFFSNISHEFRTPLTLILGSLHEVLGDRSSALSPNQCSRLEAAQRNSLRLLKLVNTLLEFTRLEAGRT
jgi:signal transduction histidine kinase